METWSFFRPKPVTPEALARQALRRMERNLWGQRPCEARQLELADQFLQRLEQSPDSIATQLAQAAHRAGQGAPDDRSRLAIYRITAEEVSSGLATQLGGVLAQIGYRLASEEKVSLADSYLQTIGKHGSLDEQEFVRQLYRPDLSPSARSTLAQVGLKLLATGLPPQGPQRTSRLGRDCLNQSSEQTLTQQLEIGLALVPSKEDRQWLEKLGAQASPQARRVLHRAYFETLPSRSRKSCLQQALHLASKQEKANLTDLCFQEALQEVPDQNRQDLERLCLASSASARLTLTQQLLQGSPPQNPQQWAKLGLQLLDSANSVADPQAFSQALLGPLEPSPWKFYLEDWTQQLAPQQVLPLLKVTLPAVTAEKDLSPAALADIGLSGPGELQAKILGAIAQLQDRSSPASHPAPGELIRTCLEACNNLPSAPAACLRSAALQQLARGPFESLPKLGLALLQGKPTPNQLAASQALLRQEHPWLAQALQDKPWLKTAFELWSQSPEASSEALLARTALQSHEPKFRREALVLLGVHSRGESQRALAQLSLSFDSLENLNDKTLETLSHNLPDKVGDALMDFGRAQLTSGEVVQTLQLSQVLLQRLSQEPDWCPAVLEQAQRKARLHSPLAKLLCDQQFFQGESPSSEIPPEPAQVIKEEAQALVTLLQHDLQQSWSERLDQSILAGLELGQLPDSESMQACCREQAQAEFSQRLQQALEAHPWLGQLEPNRWEELVSNDLVAEGWQNPGPSLSFGETFAQPPIDTASAAEPSRELIEKLVKFQEPATQLDAQVLQRSLAALPLGMLQDLQKHRYTLMVTRDRLSNAEGSLEGQLLQPGGLVDMGEGTHMIDAQGQRRILLRSHWQEGQLVIDPDSLLREIGRAYNEVISAKDGRVSSNSTLKSAYLKENSFLPARFQQPESFWPEAFARYQLDPERCQRELPESYQLLRKGWLGKHLLDRSQLQACQPTIAAGESHCLPDPFEQLTRLERLNQQRAAQGLLPSAYLWELCSQPHHDNQGLLAGLGRSLGQLRHPDSLPYSPQEGVIKVNSGLFNQPEELQQLLNRLIQSQRARFLLLQDLDNLTPESPGFQMLQDHFDRFGGLTPLLLQGSQSQLERFQQVLPGLPHYRFQTQPIPANDMVVQIERLAQAEGYQLSQEAKASLTQQSKAGDLAQAQVLWGSIKTAQTQRNHHLRPYLEQSPQAISRVISRDIAQAQVKRPQEPLQELEGMVGLGGAKRELRSVLAQISLAKLQQELGVKQERPRLNLLFEGSPGTGKTTVAKLFAQALNQVGYLKNNRFQEVRVQDLVAGVPEENVKRLFETQRGGVIFLDEIHQLKDTQEGKRAFRAMIPYLGHPDFADTVFIGAGYKDEIRDLVRDVDEGAERRFSRVPFDDYSREELGQIFDTMLQSKQRSVNPEGRQAALMRLEKERRRMKHFGNAGSVVQVIEGASKAQFRRLGQLEHPPSKSQLTELLPSDFAEPPGLLPEQVWQEIEALEGLDEVKTQLRSLVSSIEYDREVGADPLESFEPYFILDGPPGSGKTTLARLIVKLMAAYDIIPSHDLVETQGAELQAGFVGQTTTKVQKLFEKMWGQGGFIDEVGGLARAPEAFKGDASKTMLKQLEDHRGRFILVVADYPDRVNDFLDIDPGLARRFGHRFTLPALSPEGASRSLIRQLQQKDWQISPRGLQRIEERMPQLAAAGDWASNGDVRKLLNSIIAQQKSAFLEARRSSQQPAERLLFDSAIEAGFEQLLREKQAGSVPTQARKIDELLQTEQAQASQASQSTSEEVHMSAEDDRLLQAQAEVDQEFATLLANDPELQKRLEGDVNSDYLKSLARRLKTTPEEALKQLQQVKGKVKKLVTQDRLVQRFEYWCPYCGGINSPQCGYINESLEWKIQHSLKKPWTEVVRETKEVEVNE